jgi:hypothetical protein
MSDGQEFWTEERIERLEQTLANQHGNVFAEAFVKRLEQCQTAEQKRKLIVRDLLPALQHATSADILWEGKWISTQVPLRAIIQDFLYREHVVENIPTNEPDTPEQETERERLARLFSGGTPASEIVIEDRGPR